MTTIRNRIKGHRTVRAGDLVRHPLNFRRHPEHQKAALGALYQEVGFARSLLAYELPDGRLQLIDGHLRAELDPDMSVTVEVLDVTPAEADKLLLSMDPLAALAETDAEAADKLAALVSTENEVLRGFFDQVGQAAATQAALNDARAGGHDDGEEGAEEEAPPDQYGIYTPCKDEPHQAQLLAKLQKQGLNPKAVIG